MSVDQTDEEALAPRNGRNSRSDRWRIHPVIFDVPVRVYGRGLSKPSFYKEALVLFANAHGGLLLLNEPVCDGQILLLTNTFAMKEHACRVMHAHDRAVERLRSLSSSLILLSTSGKSPTVSMDPKNEWLNQPADELLTQFARSRRIGMWTVCETLLPRTP
jgi:hypothetical protein